MAEGSRIQQVRERHVILYTKDSLPFFFFFQGILMSVHLLPAPSGASKMAHRALSLLASYENGSVKLWRYHNIEKERSIEGVGWECIWSLKLHVESGGRNLAPTLAVARLFDS
jgi:hypothetical protein